MGENIKLRTKAKEYLDGEIREDEFVGWFVEHAAWNYSTTFWCHVMRLKSTHDHVGDHLKSRRLGDDA